MALKRLHTPAGWSARAGICTGARSQRDNRLTIRRREPAARKINQPTDSADRLALTIGHPDRFRIDLAEQVYSQRGIDGGERRQRSQFRRPVREIGMRQTHARLFRHEVVESLRTVRGADAGELLARRLIAMIDDTGLEQVQHRICHQSGLQTEPAMAG